jgi:hypothetical protein
MELYFLHRDSWHLEKAAMLRQYVHELKTYIHAREEQEREKHSNRVL